MKFGLDFIRKLKPCKWRYKKPLDDGVDHFGFIAQEVNEIAHRTEYGFVRVTQGGTYGIAYQEFTGPIVSAIQEMDLKIKILEEKINELTREDELGDD